MNADEQQVKTVLEQYEAALNASDTDAVMKLYEPEGVFMCPYSESAVGRSAIRAAYDSVFRAITLRVRFQVAEIIQMAPDWVLARTNSAGTTTVQAAGAVSAEANQELFIFRRTDTAWKIARYSFSSTNPPR
jgi:uncharacterized protein (TIGR02246 family)